MRWPSFIDNNEVWEGMFTLPTGEEVSGGVCWSDGILLVISQPADKPDFRPQLYLDFVHGWVKQGSRAVTLIDNSLICTGPVETKLCFHDLYFRKVLEGCIHFSEDEHEIVETHFRLSGESGSWSFPFSCDIGEYGHVSAHKANASNLPAGHPDMGARFTIEHRSDTDLLKAEESIQFITRFFWLITGARQHAENIQIVAQAHEGGSRHKFNAWFPTLSRPHSTFPVFLASLRRLIDPIASRPELEKCMSNWANLAAGHLEACYQMLALVDDYTTHRPHHIAQATASFEWGEELPPSVEAKGSSDSVQDIAKFASKMIRKEWKASRERDRVLLVLGKIHLPHTLRDKVRSRLNVIAPYLPSEMQLAADKIVAAAVKSRNKYIHGDSLGTSTGHWLHERFFVETLALIFLSSVLVECGWDMESWMRERTHTGNSHPLDRYFDLFPSRVKYVMESTPDSI